MSNITIGKNEFPINAKSLGTPLLAYSLNLSQESLREIMLNGGELSSEHMAALQQIDQIVAQVKQGRISNQVLEWHDRMSLPGLRFQDGSIPFNQIRENLGAPKEVGNWNDSLMTHMARYCEMCFPFCILPEDRSQRTRRLSLPYIFNTTLGQDIFQAVLNDVDLSLLFPIVGANEIDTSGNYFTSLGNGGGIQLATFPEQIVQSANALMRMDGTVTLQGLKQATQQLLNILRVALRGEDTKVPAAFIFSGVGLPENAEISIGDGILKSVTPAMTELVHSDGKPPTGENGRIHGCVLIRNIDFRISVVASNEPERNINDPWPVEIAEQLKDTTAIEKISLLTALAIENEDPISAKQISSVIINPLNYSGGSWRTRTGGFWNSIDATPQQLESLQHWANVIHEVEDEQIIVAVRRYLTSINERTDIADSLVDAVIGLENLFGDRNEIALTVSSCVARMLELRNEDRKAIFTEVKQIYNARSAIVHGSRKKLEKLDIPSLRLSAVKYLAMCLRNLYLHNKMLIPLSPSDRIQEILLRNDSIQTVDNQ